MNAEKLKEILDKHLKWLRNEEDGERADLSGANLYGANLSRADLYGANLYGANLFRAEIEIELLNKFYPICCPEYGAFVGKSAGKTPS